VLADRAKQQADRAQDLLQRKVASQDEYDAANAAAQALAQTLTADQAAAAFAQAGVVSAKGRVQQAEAALATAAAKLRDDQLQIDRCTIKAPIAGRVGDVLVTAGNLVKADDATLVVINQVQPIDVHFAVPQRGLGQIRQYQAAGPITVEAAIPDDGEQVETGQLTFIDNAADPASGTITMGASFPNRAERLWPGLYVRIRMRLMVQQDALVVPAEAVQIGQRGKYVYIVTAEGKAVQREVAVARTVGPDAVIASGLQAGDEVVTEGHLRLTDGALVERVDAPAPAKEH
jgi:multidrug efflux system membrane fusion protein